MTIKPIKTKIVKRGDSLFDIVTESLKEIPEKSVIVITSKIVALMQGRVVKKKSDKQKNDLIRKESEYAVETQWCMLTIKDGIVMPNAGIDESNADGKLILAPENTFGVARTLREQLQDHYGVHDLGILITDSRVAPLRRGTIGIALGYAGFLPLRSYIGVDDLFGRPEEITKLNIADNLASASVLVIGEGAEQTPLAHITDAPVEFADHVSETDLFVDPKEDLYYPLFRSIGR